MFHIHIDNRKSNPAGKQKLSHLLGARQTSVAGALSVAGLYRCRGRSDFIISLVCNDARQAKGSPVGGREPKAGRAHPGTAVISVTLSTFLMRQTEAVHLILACEVAFDRVRSFLCSRFERFCR
jgi:hypothetical protein